VRHGFAAGASDFWFTAAATCVPGGPNFSFTYYITYAALVGAVAGMAGVSLFQMYLSRGTFRMAFCSTLLLKLLASLFDLLIVGRANVRFGVPDRVAFLLGDAIIYNVAAMMDFMPAVVLTSASCPRGMEATVYSLLAGFQNFGSNVARAVGVGLINQLGIRTVEPCNFDNFPLAILVSHVLLPLTTLPLIFVLIPPHRMTERLFDDEDEPAAGPPEASQADVASKDGGTDDDAAGGGADAETGERRALVRPATQAVDMELDSLYSESERDSVASSVRRDGESPSLPFSPNFPPSSSSRPGRGRAAGGGLGEE
jgi:BT1 family